MTESKYLKLVDSMRTEKWSTSTVGTNIPGHPEVRFSSPDQRYEVEISPVNGYDDGNLHEDSLEFFVNVFEYYVDEEENERLEEKGQLFSRRRDDTEGAVNLAKDKMEEYI